MIDEGYIKFACRHELGNAPQHPLMAEFMRVRDELHALGLIGILPEGIGYGNISIRAAERYGFIVSASATGGICPFKPQHASLVTRFDIEANSVSCVGPMPASSESMSHGAIYLRAAAVGCVIHVHDRKIFEMMLADGSPATPPGVAYGTPAMARAAGRIASGQDRICFVMTGHQDGVIAAGRTLVAARDMLLEKFRQSRA